METHETKPKPARSARSARRRKQTRDEILQASLQVVLRHGLAGFTLTTVAKALGLTKPALYYYFSSKEALVFELYLNAWVDGAARVRDAVEQTESGADAVEALMRTTFELYKTDLRVFGLAFRPWGLGQPGDLIGPSQLERIRPINDMLYSGAEARLRADQEAGTFPRDRDPRRFAFTAHMAVIGILTMKSLAESADDALIHGDDELIDDVCRTFRGAARPGATS